MIILSSLFGLRVIFVRLDKNERLVYNDSNKPSAREAQKGEKHVIPSIRFKFKHITNDISMSRCSFGGEGLFERLEVGVSLSRRY